MDAGRPAPRRGTVLSAYEEGWPEGVFIPGSDQWRGAHHAMEDAVVPPEDLDRAVPVGGRCYDPRLLWQTDVFWTHQRTRLDLASLADEGAVELLAWLRRHTVLLHREAVRDEETGTSTALRWALDVVGVPPTVDVDPWDWLEGPAAGPVARHQDGRVRVNGSYALAAACRARYLAFESCRSRAVTRTIVMSPAPNAHGGRAGRAGRTGRAGAGYDLQRGSGAPGRWRRAAGPGLSGGARVRPVAQTEGDPLPEVAPALLTGQAPAGLWNDLASQVTGHGYALERGDCSGANGYTDPTRRVVRVRDDIGPLWSELGEPLAEAPVFGSLRRTSCQRAAALLDEELGGGLVK